jgi:hypothetical protein
MWTISHKKEAYRREHISEAKSCLVVVWNVNNATEYTNLKTKNTGAGQFFFSTKARCGTIPKELHLSWIVPY